jgi:predicted ATPase
LLVLDTCEHVIEPVATVVDALLRTTTGLQILATSQESLAIPGERLLTVPPLDPSSAAELFTSRANLELTNENAIADICRRLDGLPLALELAAARVRTLGLTELHARLDDRFAVLATVRRGGLTRQQTLRATLDRSWNLLSAPEQAVLRRLSALEGEWTLATADEDDLEALARLVDRSLVLMTDHPDGARYRLLESTRAYALGAYVQSAAGAFQTGGEEGSDWSHAAIEGQ